MELMDWFPTGIIITVSIFLFFGYSFARGVAVIADQRRGIDRKGTGISTIYVIAMQRKSTEIVFYLLLFVSPILGLFIPGLLIEPVETIMLMINNWYAFFGLLVLSFTFPFCMSETGEEKEEWEYQKLLEE